MVFLFQEYFSITSFCRKIIKPNQTKPAMSQAACHGHVAGAACGDFQVSGGDGGRVLSAGERGDILGLFSNSPRKRCRKAKSNMIKSMKVFFHLSSTVTLHDRLQNPFVFFSDPQGLSCVTLKEASCPSSTLNTPSFSAWRGQSSDQIRMLKGCCWSRISWPRLFETRTWGGPTIGVALAQSIPTFGG